MGRYVVTGAASGMGAEAATRLRASGHTVIGVDITACDAVDVVTDLSTEQGRDHAARQVVLSTDHLDGAVLAAGLGPAAGRDRLRQIAEVNVSGTVDLLRHWRPLLATPGDAKVVVLGSNSATTVPGVPARTVAALLAGDTAAAVRSLRMFGPVAPTLMYAASKIAVTRWSRRTAVLPAWAGVGIRLNVLAPGAVQTPLLEEQLAHPRQGKAVRRFPIPVGKFGDADDIARWVCFMLSDAAESLCGSVIVVDGGTDAHFRADDWPRAVSLRRLPRYLRQFRG